MEAEAVAAVAARAVVRGGARGGGTGLEAPAVFNEASFHGVNVDENGRVPAHEVEDSFSRINFRAARSSPATTANLDPNLTASYPRVDGSPYPANTQLIVRIPTNSCAA